VPTLGDDQLLNFLWSLKTSIGASLTGTSTTDCIQKRWEKIRGKVEGGAGVFIDQQLQVPTLSLKPLGSALPKTRECKMVRRCVPINTPLSKGIENRLADDAEAGRNRIP
jgi:hypothetical protein